MLLFIYMLLSIILKLFWRTETCFNVAFINQLFVYLNLMIALFLQ